MMSFPIGFYALGGAWLFLLLAPLVLFYFLKLKRPRLEIPSLALWRQVLNDQRVNSPFPKFKRNLLLLLQVLLLVLLVLAAMQPFVQTGAERAEYLPVLIDCSASMAALDTPGGRSRLELAKERVGKMIDNMLPDQRLSLIEMHSSARRLTDFTNNQRLLRDALGKIAVVDVASRLEDGLSMAQGLARTVPIETVVVYSDGNFAAQVDFELPFDVNYQRIERGGPNVGITAFNGRRSRTDRWDVFVGVEGTDGSAEIELLQDGKSVGGETARVVDGRSARLVFEVSAETATSLEARLKPSGPDSLSADNVAFLDLPPARPLTVYVRPELASYRHALAAMQDVVVYPADEGRADTDASPPAATRGDSGGMPASGYDLLITDREDESALDATVTLFVGVVPRDLGKLVSVAAEVAHVVDWQRSVPLLQHVQLTNVLIGTEPRSALGVRDADYEALGYEILAHGQRGPLILKKRTGQKLAFFLLFHTDRSTLPYRVGFPILVTNAVEIALSEAAISEVRGQPTGVLPPLWLRPDRGYRVTGPDGSATNVRSDSGGGISGVPAVHVGSYLIAEGATEVARVGVSLLNAQETSLAAVDEILFREYSVSAAETKIETDRPLWGWLAGLALCVLLVEWWYFLRRPGGVPT